MREILREKSAWKSRMMLSARRLKEQFFTLGTGETTTDPETDRDRTITGCAQPDLNLGWSNNFQYKKLKQRLVIGN